MTPLTKRHPLSHPFAQQWTLGGGMSLSDCLPGTLAPGNQRNSTNQIPTQSSQMRRNLDLAGPSAREDTWDWESGDAAVSRMQGRQVGDRAK